VTQTGNLSQQAKERKRKGSASPKACSTQATVLVVDDDPSVLPAMARLIRSAGYAVIGFDRPSAVLARDIPRNNACIVVDVHLPEMNGLELCKALAGARRHLPVIMMSGRKDPGTLRLMQQADPVAILFKPIDEAALFEAIDRGLAESRRRS
jgi:FixJ family two-component response regulator